MMSPTLPWIQTSAPHSADRKLHSHTTNYLHWLKKIITLRTRSVIALLLVLPSFLTCYFAILAILLHLSEWGSHSQIEFLLSLIEIPTFSLGLTQEEIPPTELIPATVPVSVANDDIGETRKSRRTRTLPPLLNDYQCDPKIKAFRGEQPPLTPADNIDEIYMSMRESAGQNKYVSL